MPFCSTGLLHITTWKALAEKQITLKVVYGDMYELNMGTLIEEHPFQIKKALSDVQYYAFDILTDY